MYGLRKPQTSKKKYIQDWHLVVFVSVMVLIDILFLSLFTILEGVLDRFGLLRVPNRENLSTVSGVRESKLSLKVICQVCYTSTGTRNNHCVLY